MDCESTLHETVGAIYDTALDHGRWPQTMELLADTCGARSASLTVVDQATGQADNIAPHVDPADLRRFNDRWWRYAPGLEKILRQPVGRVYTREMIVDTATFLRSSYYNEYWRHIGLGSTWTNVNLLSRDGALTIFSLSPGQEPCRPPEEQRTLTGFLAPHLVRAVRIQQRLRQVGLEKEAGLALAEGNGNAVMLVDAAGRVVFADDAAAALLDTRSGLRLERGVLTLANSPGELERLVTSCANPPLRGAAGGILTGERNGCGAPIEIEVIPFRPETAQDEGFSVTLSKPVAMVVVTDHERKRGMCEAELRRDFGLTPAEARLALEIIKGDGRAAAAQRLDISVSTARMHLSRIFDKTGVHRQAELVRLLGNL